MRKPVHRHRLDAPAALLALSLAAAAGPAWAGPKRLDDGRLAGVAAGQELGFGLDATSVNRTLTSTELGSLNELRNSVTQAFGGRTVNNNYATGIGSRDVTATGDASTIINGVVMGLGGLGGR